MNDVVQKKIHWLWNPFIAMGEFTILEGMEGLGKSWIACAIATAIAGGCALPFHSGDPIIPSNVLILSAEDSLSHTIKPRLELMGADQSRIFAIGDVFSLDSERDLIHFEAIIAEYKPKLIIIDPMFSYTGGKDLNNEHSSRPLARKLIAIAQKFECAIVGIRHIGKSKGNGEARSAGLGSIAWRASARSVILVGQDPDTGECALCQTKNNLAEQGKISVGFEIKGGNLMWHATPSNLSKERMLAQSSDQDAKAEQCDAEAFLKDFLQDGEKASKEVQKEAKTLGISSYALRRARVSLGVRSIKKGGNFGGVNAWFLSLKTANEKAEEAAPLDTRLHQANSSSKSSYSNSLTEEVAFAASDHLQRVYTPTSIPLQRRNLICACGELGRAGYSCRNCGETIVSGN